MKNVFYFSRRERMALCLLALLLVLALGMFWFIEYRIEGTDDDDVRIDSTEEIERFVAKVKLEKKDRRLKDSMRFAPHVFDPNICDSSDLADFGLKVWQIKTFLKYRKAGARFYNRQDLMRVYSFSEKDVDRMMPYAVFPQDERLLRKAEAEQKRQWRDSVYNALVASYPQKLKEGEWVELDRGDTSELKKIPGIGSYYASKIVRYSERLGGFASVEQLKEIEGLPTDVCKWVRLNHIKIKRLNINTADFKTLIRHPYLNYEQVKAIFNHRNKYGSLTSLKQLSTETAFTAEDLKKLEPYIAFE